MKYCNECGAEMKDNTKVCKECGFLADTDEEDFSGKDSFKEDKFSFGWGLFGFFMPLCGFILYIAWRRDLPRRARSVGKGAFIIWLTILLLALGQVIGVMLAEHILYK